VLALQVQVRVALVQLKEVHKEQVQGGRRAACESSLTMVDWAATCW
jgi:hypothetical protein